jgi:hypothetical protein
VRSPELILAKRVWEVTKRDGPRKTPIIYWRFRWRHLRIDPANSRFQASRSSRSHRTVESFLMWQSPDLPAGVVFTIPALLIGLSYSTVIPGNVPGALGHAGVILIPPSCWPAWTRFRWGRRRSEGNHLVLHHLAFAVWLRVDHHRAQFAAYRTTRRWPYLARPLRRSKARTVSIVALVLLFLLVLLFGRDSCSGPLSSSSSPVLTMPPPPTT